MTNFWIFEVLQIIFIYNVTFLLGLFVTKLGIRVNYTRKIFSLSLLFMTMYLVEKFRFTPTPYTTVIHGIMLVLCLYSMSKPLRVRSRFLTTTFASISRPEDVPYTLIWFPTETIIMSSILFFMQVYLSTYEQSILFYIVILTVGIGDGLAEPIGVRFGKHKYKVRSLASGREYVRSLEGSLTVFISGVIIVYFFQQYLTPDQFLLALLIIPLTITITEALSPHTWDGPFMYLMGSIATIVILKLAPNPLFIFHHY